MADYRWDLRGRSQGGKPYAAGDTLARDAKFVPLPDKVQANAFKVLSSIVGAGGERIGVDSLRGVSNSWR